LKHKEEVLFGITIVAITLSDLEGELF